MKNKFLTFVLSLIFFSSVANVVHSNDDAEHSSGICCCLCKGHEQDEDESSRFKVEKNNRQANTMEKEPTCCKLYMWVWKMKCMAFCKSATCGCLCSDVDS